MRALIYPVRRNRIATSCLHPEYLLNVRRRRNPATRRRSLRHRIMAGHDRREGRVPRRPADHAFLFRSALRSRIFRRCVTCATSSRPPACTTAWTCSPIWTSHATCSECSAGTQPSRPRHSRGSSPATLNGTVSPAMARHPCGFCACFVRASAAIVGTARISWERYRNFWSAGNRRTASG